MGDAHDEPPFEAVGKTLEYQDMIRVIREATPEVEHGHVHGAGGVEY